MAIKDKIKTRWQNYKSTLTKKTIMTNLWHCVLMVLGNACLAFGTAMWLYFFNQPVWNIWFSLDSFNVFTFRY